MADPMLEYILTQERAGFTQEQIRQALLSQGYQAQVIDATFKSLQHATTDPAIHEYVQGYAQQGQTPLQIFKTLTEQGYAAGKVRKSIIDVFGPGTLPKQPIILYVILAIAVAGSALYLLQASTLRTATASTSNATLDLSSSERIAEVITIAQQQGEQPAVTQCQLTLADTDRDRCILDIAILSSINDDKLCAQISDVSIKDSCLMNFVNTDPTVCKQVQLQANVDTCNTLLALKNTSTTST